MKLYYNEELQKFSLTSAENYVEVFETHHKEKVENGKNEIKYGCFRIIIQTNFYPQSPEREYIYVDIFINEVLFLPLSLACRKADVHYHFSKHQIAFKQWGAGQNIGRDPHTIMQIRDKIDWSNILNGICEICNDYKEWILREILQLKNDLAIHKMTEYWDVSTFIELVRTYEHIIPESTSIFCDFIDDNCKRSMIKIIESIDSNDSNPNKEFKKKSGDIIWNYIKDYHLN